MKIEEHAKNLQPLSYVFPDDDDDETDNHDNKTRGRV